MPETTDKCLLCNAQLSQLFDQRTFDGQLDENHIDLACEFVYQSPSMTPFEINDFYQVNIASYTKATVTPATRTGGSK